MKVRNNTNRKLKIYFHDVGDEEPVIEHDLDIGKDLELRNLNFDFMTIQEPITSSTNAS